MSYTRFDEHFWGQNGPDVIEKRLIQGNESTKYFSYFLEERANIEEIYSRSIHKLLKSTSNLVEFGTTRDCWLSIRGEMENLARLHHELSNSLHKEMGIPMNKFKDEQAKMRRQYLSDASKLNKERKLLEYNIQKFRERYEEYARKAEAAQQKVEQAKQQNKNPNDVAKLSQGAQKLAKEELLFEQEYKDAITKLAAFQPTWEEKIAAIYLLLQQQEEERIEYTKTTLQKYVQALEVSAPYYVESCRRLADVTKRIDKNEDIMCFIRENQTGSDKPSVPSFISYKGGSSGGSYSTPTFSPPASTPSPAPSYSSPTPSYSAPPQPAPRMLPPSSNGKAKRKVKALYDYVGADANELDFFAGDTITVISEDASGWWTGEVDGRQGLFPSNYVQ
eukprot:Phypoly_transcript_02073.p1 GENE.Phypoly_transcript_02073~~Phypoly_transcript_02073.p1  ORF type:complete len:391 (+),score=73.31 Phypoly_transcript_02073:1675-2847(+)